MITKRTSAERLRLSRPRSMDHISTHVQDTAIDGRPADRDPIPTWSELHLPRTAGEFWTGLAAVAVLLVVLRML